MICTMCMHGIPMSRVWVCSNCRKHHCPHQMRCCGVRRSCHENAPTFAGAQRLELAKRQEIENLTASASFPDVYHPTSSSTNASDQSDR